MIVILYLLIGSNSSIVLLHLIYGHAVELLSWGIGPSQGLYLHSLAVTLRTTRFNIKKSYVVPTLRLCVLYGSQNKQQLLPYKTLRDWFL
jgi:hypothetical protein